MERKIEMVHGLNDASRHIKSVEDRVESEKRAGWVVASAMTACTSGQGVTGTFVEWMTTIVFEKR